MFSTPTRVLLRLGVFCFLVSLLNHPKQGTRNEPSLFDADSGSLGLGNEPSLLGADSGSFRFRSLFAFWFSFYRPSRTGHAKRTKSSTPTRVLLGLGVFLLFGFPSKSLNHPNQGTHSKDRPNFFVSFRLTKLGVAFCWWNAAWPRAVVYHSSAGVQHLGRSQGGFPMSGFLLVSGLPVFRSAKSG